MYATRALPATQEQALEWLWRVRFSSDGRRAACRKCGRTRTHHRIRSRPAWECDSCGSHIHPTAGTVLERSRTPIPVWIAAARSLCAYPDLSARQLQAELGVSYKTAWRMRRVLLDRLPADVGATPAEPLVAALLAAEVDEPIEGSGGVAWRRSRARRRASVLGTARAIVSEGREKAILEAACNVLMRRGFVATRMSDVAAEATVSVGTLYARFESRDDLLLSAVDWANSRPTREREAIINSDASATEKLAAFLALATPTGDFGPEHALYADLWVRARTDSRVRPMVARARARWHRYFREIVDEGVANGEFAPRGSVDEIVTKIVAIQTGLGVEAMVGFDWMGDDRARALLIVYVAAELGIAPAALDAGRTSPRD
jgi:AcrR family transcriptional regulator/transposase-like protein